MKFKTYPIKWIITDIAIGYAPRSYTDLNTIKEHGIEAIINLCAECYDLSNLESEAGFNVYSIPVIDEHAPSLEEVLNCLEHMDSLYEAKTKTLIHCRYGIGRTGTFALALLLWRGYTLKEALAILKDTPARPQNRSQWKLIEDLAEHLKLFKESRASSTMKEKVKPLGFFDRLQAWIKWHE